MLVIDPTAYFGAICVCEQIQHLLLAEVLEGNRRRTYCEGAKRQSQV
jgi:hypothetical protein